MDLTAYKIISPRINEAIKVALEANGFKVDKINAGVGDDGTLSLNIKAHDANATETPEEIHWKKYARIYFDMNPDWLGVSFTDRMGRTCKILGLLNTRSDKSVSLEVQGKKMICTPEAMVKIAAGAGLPPAKPVSIIAADNLTVS